MASSTRVAAFWQCNRFQLDWTSIRLMGIVNLTPDSFSDGRGSVSPSESLRHAERLLQQGADILDLGAESSRPGALPLPLEQELQRLLPVLRELVKWGVPISVDTYKPQVMQLALEAGADIINDIWALRQPGAKAVVAAHPRCGVCLMHMHGEPQSMQHDPMVGPALPRVKAFLSEQAQQLRALGVAAERIALDPGIGFGKTVEQNFELLAQQARLADLGYPLLVGWSRKSALGAVTGLEVQQRQVPSVVAAVLAAQRGAQILRVHDVAATRAGLQVWRASLVQNGQPERQTE